MSQYPEIKLHTYEWVQSLEQFRSLLWSLKEKEPKYYEELTRYLVTAGKTRVQWYRDVVNHKLDEMALMWNYARNKTYKKRLMKFRG